MDPDIYGGFVIFQRVRDEQQQLNNETPLHKLLTEIFRSALMQNHNKNTINKWHCTKELKYSQFFTKNDTTFKITIQGKPGKRGIVNLKLQQGFKRHNRIMKMFLKELGL